MILQLHGISRPIVIANTRVRWTAKGVFGLSFDDIDPKEFDKLITILHMLSTQDSSTRRP